MASSALECGTCSQVFSEDRCPRLLPCSHTLCDYCINGIISSSQRKTCPFCRKEFSASSPNDMMIIKSLLDVAKLVSFMHDDPKAPCRGPKRSMVKFTKDIRKKITKKGITECQKTRTQVMDVIEILNGMKNGATENYDKIDVLIKELQKLQLSCASTLSHIDQNTKVLKNSLDVMVQKEDKFKDLNAKLGAATESTSAVVIMDEAKEVLEEVQDKVKEIKELLQKNEVEKDRVEKDILDTKTRLEEERRIEDNSPVKITINDLVSLSGSLREIIRREIFAVKSINGHQMVAPVKVESENHLCLGHLAKGDVPPKSCVIKHEFLMEEPLGRAYLDLGVDGTIIGRMTIKLMEESNLALNFLHMCAGDMGPSYANSRALSVSLKRKDGEMITMGEYASQDKTSTAPASDVARSPGLDWEEESQRESYDEMPLKAGNVMMNAPRGGLSSFSIVTRDNTNVRSRYYFGVVEEGLDLLQDAIGRYPDIKKVQIVDCGLMLSL